MHNQKSTIAMSVGHPSPIWRWVGGEVKKWKGYTYAKGETFLASQ